MSLKPLSRRQALELVKLVPNDEREVVAAQLEALANTAPEPNPEAGNAHAARERRLRASLMAVRDRLR